MPKKLQISQRIVDRFLNLEIDGEPYRYIFSFGSNNIKQLLSRCRETEEVKKICCGWRSDLLDLVKPYIRAGKAKNFSRSFFRGSEC